MGNLALNTQKVQWMDRIIGANTTNVLKELYVATPTQHPLAQPREEALCLVVDEQFYIFSGIVSGH